MLLLVTPPPTAHAGPWRRPVDGAVLRAFAVGSNPYARGQHRGVDLAAAPGSGVRSACAGRVTFAGRVPRGGRTVSVRCGGVVATYQQLATIAVRRGQRIAPGVTLGFAGRSADPRDRRSHVHLGARDAASGRYIDPLTLLRGMRPALPVLPLARGRPRALPRGRTPVRALRRTPQRGPSTDPLLPRPLPQGFAPSYSRASPSRPAGSPVGSPLRPSLPFPTSGSPSDPGPGRDPAAAFAASEPRIPLTVWIGLMCVGVALRIGGLIRRRRRERAAPAVARTT